MRQIHHKYLKFINKLIVYKFIDGFLSLSIIIDKFMNPSIIIDRFINLSINLTANNIRR